MMISLFMLFIFFAFVFIEPQKKDTAQHTNHNDERLKFIKILPNDVTS